MNDQPYVPNPIDTSRVALPPALSDLIEKLSRNTHEVWAQKRVDDGWKLGNRRDDTKKLHPDLVSYEQLSEQEKSYDREVVTQVVKVILALGYTIEKR